MAEDGLRIDKFLWFSRLARTRALARKIAQKGHIRCAGRRIDRAHAMVRTGDVLSVPMPGGVRVIRIDTLPERRVSPKLVAEVYRTVESLDDRKR
ncbi:S4 domain-containing protein [Parasphingopyxis lamellibrachiae]|uniref:Ribosome-associated heat shock protein Hsp15 n=1 Tax=Parasphingopyxis lamellibrachiae TaxID=680125 RepID=A0A3D9FGN5_9SPHN|nr:S4 domain-containing protein [Parasphingopyxis lamellibrachiae]RED16965.1 ribosome-associated heat shock protein Hsp15 [Parasphingopyxis lamellibrachiae]